MTYTPRLSLCTLSLAAALTAGCSPMTAPPMQGGMPSTTATAGAGGVQDLQFATLAAGNGLYEVEASRLAMSRSTRSDVRDYAQMLVNHHTMANDELASLVRGKGLPVPGTLPADKKIKLNALSTASGTGFDRLYLTTTGIEDHQADIALYERASREVSDPALRAFAGRTLPRLQMHLQAARTLAAGSR